MKHPLEGLGILGIWPKTCFVPLEVDDLVTASDAKEALALTRRRAEMLRHHAMVQMLTERSILMEIEAEKSDRCWDWMDGCSRLWVWVLMVIRLLDVFEKQPGWDPTTLYGINDFTPLLFARRGVMLGAKQLLCKYVRALKWGLEFGVSGRMFVQLWRS